MIVRPILTSLFIVLAASLVSAGPLTSEFTYQGQLKNGGNPTNGPHDFLFRLFDAGTVGVQVGATVCLDNVTITNGLFTVSLDFGTQFSGEKRFLEISVRTDTGLDCTNPTGYAVLSPRQPITAAPNSLFSLTAGNSTSSTLLNSQPPAYYLNASNINSGTLSDDRQSANVCLLDREQSFIDEKHFAARPTFDNPTLPFAVESNARIPNLNADLLDGFNSSDFLHWSATGADIHNANAGKVGIGTSNPTSQLTVHGGLFLSDVLDEDVIIDTGNFYLRNRANLNLAYHYVSDPEQHDFFTGNSSCMTMVPGGNIGLGTQNPTSMLHLKPRLDQTCIRMEADRYISSPTSLSGSNATVTQVAGTGATWANPGFAGSLNGISASAALTTPAGNNETVDLDFRSLGFNLPANAVVRGVHIQLTGSGGGACSSCQAPYAGLDYLKRAWLANGASLGAERNNRSAAVGATLGNANDTWGLPLTPAIVNASTFGVRLRVRMIPISSFTDITHPNGAPFDCYGCTANATVSLDGIAVTIEYGSPALAHAEYTVGIGPDNTDFRISPSADYSADGLAINQDGVVDVAFGSGGIRLNVHGGAAKPGGGSWTTLSDARFKRDIQPLEGTLDRLITLRGYSFEYTPDALARNLARPGRQMGLIAQEVEKVFPDWIDYTEDGYRMVTERATTALLVEALRDLREEKDRQVEALSARNSALSARLESLETAVQKLAAAAPAD